MPICKNCGKSFPNRIKIEGHVWHLTSRKFCPECSKLGKNNRRQYIINIEDGYSYCARCMEVKPESEFHKRSNKKPLSYCKKCSEEVKSLKFEEKLDKIIMNFGGICEDCLQTYPSTVFRFWKEDKVFPISRIKNMSFQKAIEALNGYKLLCLNCVEIRKWQSKY